MPLTGLEHHTTWACHTRVCVIVVAHLHVVCGVTLVVLAWLGYYPMTQDRRSLQWNSYSDAPLVELNRLLNRVRVANLVLLNAGIPDRDWIRETS